jgi:hypothetical protein
LVGPNFLGKTTSLPLSPSLFFLTDCFCLWQGNSCTIDEDIFPGTIAHLFDTLAGSSLSSTVKVSYIELQNEQLNDLLNEGPERPSLSIREDSKGQIHWTGVKEMDVYNANDVLS